MSFVIQLYWSWLLTDFFVVHETQPVILFNLISIHAYSYKSHWARGYKTFFMLNSIEHEILTAHKNWNTDKMKKFLALSL